MRGAQVTVDQIREQVAEDRRRLEDIGRYL